MKGDWQWSYRPSTELDLTLLERLRRYPREADMIVFLLRTAAALAFRLWLKAYHRLRLEGKEHLPREGSFILVANHASHLDALCLLSALPLPRLHQAYPAAAADYFFVSLARGCCSALLFNAIPFQRQGGASRSLMLCRGLLERPGTVLVLFPEGTRSADGQVAEFKAGIGILAAETGVPVLPCRLEGAFAAWPKGSRWPRPRPVRLRIGPPRTYAGAPLTWEGALAVAQDLRAAVLAL